MRVFVRKALWTLLGIVGGITTLVRSFEMLVEQWVIYHASRPTPVSS